MHEVAYFKWFSLHHSKAGFQKCPSGSRVIGSEDKRVFGTDFRDRHLVAWHPSMPASQETVGPAHCGPYHARVQNSWAFVYALLTFRGLIRHCKWTVCVYLLKVIWARTASCQSRRPVFLAPGFGWKSWGLSYDSWEIAYQTWPGYNYTCVPPCREILIRWSTVDGKRVLSAMPQGPGFSEAAILKHKRWATAVFLNPL